MKRSRVRWLVAVCGVQLGSFVLVAVAGLAAVTRDGLSDEFAGLGVFLAIIGLVPGAGLCATVIGVVRGSRNAVAAFAVVEGCLTAIMLFAFMRWLHPAFAILFVVFLASTGLAAWLLRTTRPRTPADTRPATL